MLLGQLSLKFIGFLVKLLPSLQRLLLKLLATGRKLLLKLRMLRLHVLLHLGGLLTDALQHLFALLANLFTHVVDLTFRFLTDRRLGKKLFALLLGFVDDLVGLSSGSGNELITLLEQLIGLLDLAGHCFSDRVKQLNSILLVNEPSAAEGNATSLQHDLLELVELVEYGEPDLAHRCGWLKAELKNLMRSSATTGGTIWSTDPPKRATSFTTELLRKL